MTIPARTETIRESLPGLQGQTLGLTGVGQSIWAQELLPKHKVGSRLQLGCRVFYYSRADSTGLTAGKMAVYAVDSDEETDVTVAHPIGTTELTVTAASDITKDQYAEGTLGVFGTGGAGVGDQYIVKTNAVIANAATGTVTIYEPGLVTAWVTTTTDICLWTNPYYGISQSTSIESSGAGIPLRDVTASYYYWLQTYGPAMVLIKESTTSGAATGEQAMSVNTAGDLYPQIAGMYQAAHTVEKATDAIAVDADFGFVYLTCAA